MPRKSKYRTFDEDIIMRLREDEAYLHAYVSAAFEDYYEEHDIRALSLALRYVVEARGGLTKMSAKTGIAITTLESMLNGKGNPTSDKLMTLCDKGIGAPLMPQFPNHHVLH